MSVVLGMVVSESSWTVVWMMMLMMVEKENRDQLGRGAWFIYTDFSSLLAGLEHCPSFRTLSMSRPRYQPPVGSVQLAPSAQSVPLHIASSLSCIGRPPKRPFRHHNKASD